jgi:hypothetical protein
MYAKMGAHISEMSARAAPPPRGGPTPHPIGLREGRRRVESDHAFVITGDKEKACNPTRSRLCLVGRTRLAPT